MAKAEKRQNLLSNQIWKNGKKVKNHFVNRS